MHHLLLGLSLSLSPTLSLSQHSHTLSHTALWLLSRLVRLCARSFLVAPVVHYEDVVANLHFHSLLFGYESYMVCRVYIFATTPSSLRVTCVRLVHGSLSGRVPVFLSPLG